MTLAVTLVFTCALSFSLSWVSCELMKKTGVVDAPDGERKLQAQPVPRLGGLGVITAIFIVYALSVFIHQATPALLGGDWLPGNIPTVWMALAASLALALIGAIDDIWGLGAATKLTLVLVVCVTAPLLGVTASAMETPFGAIAMPGLLVAGSALWLLVFSNAANFMDGSNGLAMGSLAIMLLGLMTSLMLATGAGPHPGLAAAVAAIAAFLVHNMRGQLYAGDAGALGLGGLFATLALVSDLPVWTIATLALPFLTDVLLTLVLRTRRGEPLLKAHLDHAYQALLKDGWSHFEVAVLWWTMSATCAVAASVGAAAGGALPFVLFWLLALVLSGGWMLIHRETNNKVAGARHG